MIRTLYLILLYTGYLFIALSVFSLSFFIIVSWFENEKRAVGKSLILLIGISAFVILSFYVPIHIHTYFYAIVSLLFIIAIIILFIPYHVAYKPVSRIPLSRIDERDIMFSRCLLEPGTDRYNSYYKQRSEYKELDDHFRQNPGLLGIDSTFFKPLQFAAAEASFDTISGLHHLVDNPQKTETKSGLSADAHTRFIKKWLKKLGAHSAGICELKPYHIYSHVGRGPDFGNEVQLDHKYAIALTVEMDKVSLDAAPYAPTVMESAQQYVNAGVIAIQLAEFIRGLGFQARAHIDGNYRVVCPLVARDAGLGEIGRMGLLMTPELGPRVRIAVVTTDLPVLSDIMTEDDSVHEFCMRCKKCAEVCPSKAISFGEPQEIDGINRWQINQEKCFTYWMVVGTDCGRCVSVCPYSHPNNILHNLIRKGLSHSSAFQSMALKMDDFFYGRKPEPKNNSEFI